MPKIHRSDVALGLKEGSIS